MRRISFSLLISYKSELSLAATETKEIASKVIAGKGELREVKRFTCISLYRISSTNVCVES